MADQAGMGNGGGLRSMPIGIDDHLESRDLTAGEGQQERLEKNSGFAEAGVQVNMNRIQDFPVAMRIPGRRNCERCVKRARLSRAFILAQPPCPVKILGIQRSGVRLPVNGFWINQFKLLTY